MFSASVKLSKFPDEHWFVDFEEFYEHIDASRKKLEDKLKVFLAKNTNQARLQESSDWYGLHESFYEKYFESSTPVKGFKIEQDEKADKIPTYSASHSFVRFTQADYDECRKRPLMINKYCRFTNGKKDNKFNKPFYLAHGADNGENENTDTGTVKIVSVGQTDNDEDCIRALHYFFRSTLLSINRHPYVPDLSLKLSDIHGTGLKLNYRVLVYAFGSYVKLNININRIDGKTREKLMLNDKETWFDKQNISMDKLCNLFYSNWTGASRKYVKLSLNNFGSEMIEYLTKETNNNALNNWFMRGLQIIVNSNLIGFDCLAQYIELWRPEGTERSDHILTDSNNEWMFELIDVLKPNECLFTIKLLQIVGAKIGDLLLEAYQDVHPRDSRLIIKCVSFMLDVFAKGNISGLAEYLLPTRANIVDLMDDKQMDQNLGILKEMTTKIGESLRTISNLGQFDFEWIIKNKYVHQVWLTYFYGALIVFLDSIDKLENNLHAISKYTIYTSRHTQELLDAEWRRYENLLYMIYVRFLQVPAPAGAGTTAVTLIDFNEYAQTKYAAKPEWTIAEIKEHEEKSKQWNKEQDELGKVFDNPNYNNNSNKSLNLFNSTTPDARSNVSQTKSPSHSQSESKSRTRSKSQSGKCRSDVDVDMNDEDEEGSPDAQKRTVSIAIGNSTNNSSSNNSNNDNNNNNSESQNNNSNNNEHSNDNSGSKDTNTNDTNDKLKVSLDDTNVNSNDNEPTKESVQLSVPDSKASDVEEGEIIESNASTPLQRPISNNKNNKATKTKSSAPNNNKNKKKNAGILARKPTASGKLRYTFGRRAADRKDTEGKGIDTTNEIIINNNNNINDSDDLKDDRSESNDVLLNVERKVQTDGSVVYDFSNENVKIQMPRCYIDPNINDREPPSVCYMWSWDRQRRNYDHLLQYQTNSITLENGNFGELPIDKDVKVYFRGTQTSDRKQYTVKVPKDPKMNDAGECMWKLKNGKGEYIDVLNRQFSLMISPRMFIL